MDVFLPERTPVLELVLQGLGSYTRGGQRVHLRFHPAWPEFHRCVVLAHRVVPTFTHVPSDGGLLILCGSLDDELFTIVENHPRRIAIFGLREFSERIMPRLSKVRVYSAHEIGREGLQSITDSVMEHVRQWGSLQLLICPSILDPVHGSGGVPGGMSTSELLSLLSRLVFVRSLQVVELLLPKTIDPMLAAVLRQAVLEVSVDGRLPEKTVAL